VEPVETFGGKTVDFDEISDMTNILSSNDHCAVIIYGMVMLMEQYILHGASTWSLVWMSLVPVWTIAP